MIKIGIPKITEAGGKARLSADVTVDGNVSSLWVEVDEGYGRFLCAERCDAFVLGLLHYAMMHGHDICSETPMTDRLHEQLTDQFLPAYFKANQLKPISLIVPLDVEVKHPKGGDAVGTGCSCGVDSMHVYAKHSEVTHGCVWNVHGITHDETESDRRVAWRNLVRQAHRFTDEVGCKLIVGDSNYDRSCISGLAFDGSTTYGNLFFVFALQKLWRCYYVASGYDIADFSLTLGVAADPAHYEYLLFPFCSLDTIAIRLDGVACNRFEKTRDLLWYEAAERHLNVCWKIAEDGRNCTCHCPKCMRTLLDLAALNAVEKFGDVFDVGYFHSHQEEFLAEYWRGLIQRNCYALEIKNTYGKMSFPLRIRVKAAYIVARKIVKKLLRGGGTSQVFEPRG